MVQRPPLELICERQNMKGHEMKTLATTAALALALTAQAEFKIDRAAMSEKYWNIWNDEVQAKIDADIEANRKADATFEVTAPDGAEVKVEQIGMLSASARISSTSTSSARTSGTPPTRRATARAESSTRRLLRSTGTGTSQFPVVSAPAETTRTPHGSGIPFRAKRRWSILSGAVPRQDL